MNEEGNKQEATKVFDENLELIFARQKNNGDNKVEVLMKETTEIKYKKEFNKKEQVTKELENCKKVEEATTNNLEDRIGIVPL